MKNCPRDSLLEGLTREWSELSLSQLLTVLRSRQRHSTAMPSTALTKYLELNRLIPSLTPAVTSSEHSAVRDRLTGSSTIPGASALMLWDSSTSATRRTTEFSHNTPHISHNLIPQIIRKENLSISDLPCSGIKMYFLFYEINFNVVLQTFI